MNNNSDDSVIGEFTAAWGAALALISAMIFFALIYFGYEGEGQAALISSVAILASIRIFWPLRRKIWYWVTIGCIAVAHLAAIIFISWPDEGFSGIRLAPFMVLDIIVIIAVVITLNKVMRAIKRR